MNAPTLERVYETMRLAVESMERATAAIHRLRRSNAEMLEALVTIRDALRDREDVYDGADGTPRANAEMQLLSEFGGMIDAAIRRAQE